MILVSVDSFVIAKHLEMFMVNYSDFVMTDMSILVVASIPGIARHVGNLESLCIFENTIANILDNKIC